MSVNELAYANLQKTVPASVKIVAVSKLKPVSDVIALYNIGQRDFGENYVQELVDKQAQLPTDIRWHFIGHLQSNKVKYIAPFVHLIHGVDSIKLLKEINKQAVKLNRVINCLLQVHIASEETKFGFDEAALKELGDFASFTHVKILGLMGMASFSNDMSLVRKEFAGLKGLFDQMNQTLDTDNQLTTLSMGMSNDYLIAIEEGCTMIRIGSLIFGARN